MDIHISNGGISFIFVKSPFIIVILFIKCGGIRFFNSDTIRLSISIAITCAATSANYIVRLPEPGPISNITELGLISLFSIIVFIIKSLIVEI